MIFEEYKYQIIALIIILFLLCVFYPPFNNCKKNDMLIDSVAINYH